MLVALNAQLLSTSATYRTAGINRVITELVTHLRQVASDLDFLVFAPRAGRNEELLRQANLRFQLAILPTTRPAVRILWEQLVLPARLAHARADALHSLGFVSPLLWRGRSIVTVYDLSFIRFPELFNRANRVYLRSFTPRSLRQADAVVAISEHTRQEVIRLCGVSPDRAYTVHLAADERFCPAAPAEVAAFKARRGLPDQFILYQGTLEPRKNVETLVRAYAELRRRGNASPALVLAGGPGWGFKPVLSLVRALGLEQQVIFPGYVPAEEQALWYTAAGVFAYPSLYEGFGLPPLEAMACGTPVIVSNTSSLPEVVGDAGILVRPRDSTSLADALERVLIDAELREDLGRRGLHRAASFSWRRMTEQTVEIYRQVLRRAAA